METIALLQDIDVFLPRAGEGDPEAFYPVKYAQIQTNEVKHLVAGSVATTIDFKPGAGWTDQYLVEVSGIRAWLPVWWGKTRLLEKPMEKGGARPGAGRKASDAGNPLYQSGYQSGYKAARRYAEATRWIRLQPLYWQYSTTYQTATEAQAEAQKIREALGIPTRVQAINVFKDGQPAGDVYGIYTQDNPLAHI